MKPKDIYDWKRTEGDPNSIEAKVNATDTIRLSSAPGYFNAKVTLLCRGREVSTGCIYDGCTPAIKRVFPEDCWTTGRDCDLEVYKWMEENRAKDYPLYGFDGFDDPSFGMVAMKLESWLKPRVELEETDYCTWRKEGIDYGYIAFGDRSWVISRDDSQVIITAQETVKPNPRKREKLVGTPDTFRGPGMGILPASVTYTLDGELVSVFYARRGKLCSVNGPAKASFKDGRIVDATFKPVSKLF